MKSTPHLKSQLPDSVPQVSWLKAEGNYTHVYFHNGSRSLSAITLCKVCQRYPYLVRLSQQVAVDPGLIVGWHRPGVKQLVVELGGCGSPERVAVPRRRIREVRQLLRQLQV
ncbi:LytTR family transcriptional regulator [Spirosoma sp. BT702]|uniref:LytTR family transcriptional regulator n=1 Tax=Spirosoma profusum TaxID=2771354 RepID=A0A927ARQ3_9BACT|nr:LytTR family transcriptional regulator DNA-binding domain-containing protein [Spirosoma profusum]MBD2702626.1 LytTR family transcriptional regulator [Spirosoma profusum]